MYHASLTPQARSQPSNWGEWLLGISRAPEDELDGLSGGGASGHVDPGHMTHHERRGWMSTILFGIRSKLGTWRSGRAGALCAIRGNVAHLRQCSILAPVLAPLVLVLPSAAVS
jgi:hypothetical protein